MELFSVSRFFQYYFGYWSLFFKKKNSKFVLDKIIKKGFVLLKPTPQATAEIQIEVRIVSSKESLRKQDTSYLGF